METKVHFAIIAEISEADRAKRNNKNIVSTQINFVAWFFQVELYSANLLALDFTNFLKFTKFH